MASFLNNLILRKNHNLLPNNNIYVNCIRQDHGRLEPATHKVNNLEKRFLVWTGKYKKIADVPDYVGQNIVERARNRMRIKIANYMIVGTLLGCLIMVYSGKQAAKKGETIQQQNLNWHKQMENEQKEK